MMLQHYEFQAAYIQAIVPSLSIPYKSGMFCAVVFD